MAYNCPRCGEPVQRGTSSVAGIAGGAVGALLYSAFGSFQGKTCGPIPKKEFSTEDQRKMTLGSVGMVIGSLVLIIVLVAVLILLQR